MKKKSLKYTSDEKSVFNFFAYLKNFLKFSHKGIAPVIVTILLSLVVILTVISFNSFYVNFSSNTLSKIGQDSIDSSKIESVSGNTLYVSNTGGSNLTVLSVMVENNSCNVSQSLNSGTNSIHLSNNCLANLNTTTPKIIIVTNKGVLSGYTYVPLTTITSLCSNLKGGNWVEVPGNSIYGTGNFCIMKYDATFGNTTGKISVKSNSFNWIGSSGNMNITSIPGTGPIVNLNQSDARNACASLGAHYHLVTNKEWLTINGNIGNISYNWNSSHIGVGEKYHGNTNGTHALKASNNDDDGYYGTTYNQAQKRTLYLSNHQVIWDLIGNVWQWNNDSFNVASKNDLKNNNDFFWYNTSSISGYNSTSNYTIKNTGNILYGFVRGGSYGFGAIANQAYSLNLAVLSSYSSNNLGFRCAYTP